ncbi:MAG: hypothetical protein PF904_09150 [Kiritimatiellae bacterium]|jgi:hypothetical protein|nr:hypothetical protein [Kiritimatiellia bacterium]
MKSYKLIIAAALISLSASAQIKSSDFPAELKILAHLDMKSLYSSKTGDLIKETMDEKSNRKMDSFKALSGIDVMKDLDSIYFAGIGEGEGSGVIYASGRFDTKKLTSILGGNNGFKSEACGSHQIITWVDDEETHHGCFVNPSLAIASDNVDSLKKALAAIDGTGAKLSEESPFASIVKNQPNRFASVAAFKVSGMAETIPQLSMLKQAEAMVLSINQTSSENADLLIKASLKTANAEAAQQMGAMVMGLQAMMMMQAAQNPEIAALAQNFKSEIKDTNISMSLKITEAQLRKQIAEGMKKANAPKPMDGAAPTSSVQ